MKPLILFIVFGLIKASSNEVLFAICKQCQISQPLGVKILFIYNNFVMKLTEVFRRTLSQSAESRELLKELEAGYIWSYLCSKDASLSEQLTLVRGVVKEVAQKQKLNSKCLHSLNILLGHGEHFQGSYLELFIKILSATEKIEMAEISTKRLLTVPNELRRMYYEREYLFTPKNELMHDIYSQFVVVYTSLINEKVGNAVSQNIMHSTFPLVHIRIQTRYPEVKEVLKSTLLRKYISKDDFIRYDGRLHLRKTKNSMPVYQNWLRVMEYMPKKQVRMMYISEGKDVLENLKDIEGTIKVLYEQKDNPALVSEWSHDDLFNIAIVFDLIESMVAYERRKVSMAKQKQMLIESLRQFDRMKGHFT